MLFLKLAATYGCLNRTLFSHNGLASACGKKNPWLVTATCSQEEMVQLACKWQ